MNPLSMAVAMIHFLNHHDLPVGETPGDADFRVAMERTLSQSRGEFEYDG